MNQNLLVLIVNSIHKITKLFRSEFFNIYYCNVNHFHLSTPRYGLLSYFHYTLLGYTKAKFEEGKEAFSIYFRHKQFGNNTVQEK